MWTPRRILLLLSGLCAFAAAYFGYARLLGGVDGLPQLPRKFLVAAAGGELPPPDPVSPTDARLMEAFGPNCPERNYSAYPTKIEMREDGIVFAAGRPQWGADGSKFVTLAPFSLASFGKPRVPGETPEISTLHADVAVLEFDRPVGNEKDMMGGKAKLVGVELKSDPTPYSTDPRTGRVHITNNQRSADPNKALVFKTPGPVFYRVPDAAGPKPDPSAPDIWTTAAVQIENRENMPRPLRGAGLPAVAVPGSGPAVGANVVADMVLGAHTPPPTVTADGMKIYLKPAPPKAPGTPPAARKRGPAFAGVRRIELSENVVMNLWVDGRSGFPGSAPGDKPADPKAPRPAPPGDPPLGTAAAGGGLADAATLAARLREKALVQIRTLGPFRYDYETNAARFEVAPQANPHLPNHVEVTRLSALGTRDYLVCQLLELELDRPLTQGGAAPPPAAAKADPPKGAGPAFKAVRATGPHVYLSAEAERLEAQGTALLYQAAAPDPKDPRRTVSLTVLHGAPLLAVRDRSKLEAGRPDLPGQLVLVSAEPPPGSKDGKTSYATVRGPGRFDLFDPATNDTTLRASWADGLEHDKDRAGGKDLDRLVFAGAGAFEDPKGGFELRADTLKLWLEPAKAAAAGTDAGGKPLPFRLQGIGHVRGKSQDTVIRDAEHLNVWFADVPPPAPPAKPPVAAAPPARTAAAPTVVPAAAFLPQPGADAPRSPAAPTPPPLLVDPTQPAAAAKPPNPVHLSAATIEVWVVRYPQPKGEKPKPGGPPGGDGLKYELDRARCDGRVTVHQDPADPAKSPRGIDIAAATLHMTKAPAGHAMTATGNDQAFAEVHFENVSLAGPTVVIDQPNNAVNVPGKGWLKMPSGSGLGGADLAKPADLTVVWQTQMTFRGERRGAEFVGHVQAEQRTQRPADPAAKPGTPEAEPTWGRSHTACHRLELTFDKPVYFNQLRPAAPREPAKEKKADDGPRIETVVCSPAPEDGEAGRRPAAAAVVFAEETIAARTGKTVKAQWVQARWLEVRTDPARTLVTASGPGESRVLQPGSKELARPPQAGPAPPPARTALKPAEEEMKLTVVRFAGKLRIDDRKGIFQQAVYEEAVRVFHVPTENLAERIEEHAVPPRSVVLRCTDTLTVSAYKGKDGADGARQMEAVGGAKVQDDAYVGDGHTITYDGATLTLRGYDGDQATLRRRQRVPGQEDYKSGREIKYDTKSGSVNVIDSSGATITTGK